MMDDRTGGKAIKVCGALIFTFSLALFLSAQFDFYYDLNDDTMIKDILSGGIYRPPERLLYSNVVSSGVVYCALLQSHSNSSVVWLVFVPVSIWRGFSDFCKVIIYCKAYADRVSSAWGGGGTNNWIIFEGNCGDTV